MSGVYMIICTETNEFYIGGTKSPFSVRWGQHQSQMRAGTAPKLLQEAVDQHGLDKFQMIPLKEFPKKLVAQKEREAIQRLQPKLNHRMTAKTQKSSPAREHYRRSIGVADEDLDRPPYDPEIRRRRTYEVNGQWLTSREIEQRYGKKALGRLYNGVRGPALTRGL